MYGIKIEFTYTSNIFIHARDMYSEYSIIHNIIQSIDIYAVPVPLAVNSDIIDSRSCDHDHDRKFLFDFISSDKIILTLRLQ